MDRGLLLDGQFSHLSFDPRVEVDGQDDIPSIAGRLSASSRAEPHEEEKGRKISFHFHGYLSRFR